MEVFESFGFEQEIIKLWDPITDDSVWMRDVDGKFYRAEREIRPLPLRARYLFYLVFSAMEHRLILSLF